VATREKTRNLGRLSEIAQVAVKHGFGYFLERHRLTDLLPWHKKVLTAEDGAGSQRGQHLREMLDELGPTFVKFGQLLSTRPDVVPPDIIAELRKLQDDVRPFPFEQVERVVSEDLGLSIEKLFVDFAERPIAAASIGQVHEAVLPNGRKVAVKVQRPDAPRQVEADLSLLYQAAKLVKERVKALEFIDSREIVDEFARSIRQELDYRLEARNAQVFHRDFAGHPHVRIPRVYWSYTRTRVLTLEFLEGTKVTDLDPDAYTLDERREIAYLMTEAWMTMIFRHGVFHGDPHPANILVLGHPERIGLVDFGQAGKLSDDDMSKLTRLFIDAAEENVEVLPKRLADLGVRYDINQQLIASDGTVNGPRPFTNCGRTSTGTTVTCGEIRFQDQVASSSYNALQTTLRRRARNGDSGRDRHAGRRSVGRRLRERRRRHDVSSVRRGGHSPPRGTLRPRALRR